MEKFDICDLQHTTFTHSWSGQHLWKRVIPYKWSQRDERIFIFIHVFELRLNHLLRHQISHKIIDLKYSFDGNRKVGFENIDTHDSVNQSTKVVRYSH